MAGKRGRMSQSQYWAVFGVYIIGVPILVIGGIYALLQGKLAIGAALIALMLPLGGYFRVAMTKRCRDIGWPGFMPWLFFGLVASISFVSGLGRTEELPTNLSALMVLLLTGLGDLAFAVVLGCIKSRTAPDFAAVFAPDPHDQRATEPFCMASSPLATSRRTSHQDFSSFDAKVAAALEATRSAAAPSMLAERGQATKPGRPQVAFGRKADA